MKPNMRLGIVSLGLWVVALLVYNWVAPVRPVSAQRPVRTKAQMTEFGQQHKTAADSQNNH